MQDCYDVRSFAANNWQRNVGLAINELFGEAFMSKCVEIIRLRIKAEREEEFLAIEKVRFSEMRRRDTDLERRMFRLPFSTRTFVICTSWQSFEQAMTYSGERFQRERFQRFLRENVEDISIHFVEEIELDSLDGVSESLLASYSG